MHVTAIVLAAGKCLRLSRFNSFTVRSGIPTHISKMIGSGQARKKMYYVYVLENTQGKHYIGSCEDLTKRITRHNQNSVRSTKNKGPWRIIHKEEFNAKTEARRRENCLKNYKSFDYLKKVVISNRSPSSSLA